MEYLKPFEQFSPVPKLLNNKENALIYTRVSTKEQAENNNSLETQMKFCKSYAKKNGYNVIKYFGGTYESAKTDERKEFKKMLAFALKNKTIGYILVYSYDRFSRTGAEAAKICRDLFDKGIVVIAVTQEVDTSTSSGKFQQSILFSFSQFDNDLRTEKTKTGMTELLRKGYWLWTPPRGYVNLKKYHKAVDWDIQLTDEGKLLEKAFKWKAQKAFTNIEIVRKLNSMGMRINERRLSTIFKNPFYCGILVSKMIPGEVISGKHPKIVSREDFLKINSIESTHPKEHKSDNANLPLKQFVHCDSCKKPLTGFLVKKKGLFYYKCRTKGCSCTKSAKKLHVEFKTILSGFKVDPKFKDIIVDVMTYTYDSMTSELRKQNTGIKKQLSEIDSNIETIEERYALGQISYEIYDKFRSKYKNEQAHLNSKLSDPTLTSSNLKKAINKAIEMSSKLSELWGSADLKQKKKIQTLVFPDGIGYNKKMGTVQTHRVNSIFSSMPMLSEGLEKMKNGESLNVKEFSALVTAKA